MDPVISTGVDGSSDISIMPKYYIAMGQGIIGEGPELVPNDNADAEPEERFKRQGPNFYVETSTLTTCTLICGYNSTNGHGGAFHYPNRLLTKHETLDAQTALAGLHAWIDSLLPTHVTLINANKVSETKSLTTWVHSEINKRVGPGHLTQLNHKDSPIGGMEILGDVETGKLVFNTGNPRPGFEELHHPANLAGFNMSKLHHGVYDQRIPTVVLFGKDISDDALGQEDIVQIEGLRDFPLELENGVRYDDTEEENPPDSSDSSEDGSDRDDDDSEPVVQ